MSLNYGSPNQLGSHVSIAAALAYIRINKWDSNGDSTGWFQMGQQFYHSVEKQNYRAAFDNIWGDIYTKDADCQQLNWTSANGLGAVSDDDGYVTCSGSVIAPWTAGVLNYPRKSCPVPPWDFLMIAKIDHQKLVTTGVFIATAGYYNSSNPDENYRFNWVKPAGNAYVERILNLAWSGYSVKGGTARWGGVSYRHNHNYGGWTNSHQADPSLPAPLNGNAIDSGVILADVVAAGTSRWDFDRMIIAAGTNVNEDYEVRFSDLYIYRL